MSLVDSALISQPEQSGSSTDMISYLNLAAPLSFQIFIHAENEDGKKAVSSLITFDIVCGPTSFIT